ncbi:MAG: hypothetical protein SV760_05105, partial [Halobacteria archaeon]|nr:hypothetical protein [Halobacteria archaeon]
AGERLGVLAPQDDVLDEVGNIDEFRNMMEESGSDESREGSETESDETEADSEDVEEKNIEE